jgi:hypothetical protein
VGTVKAGGTARVEAFTNVKVTAELPGHKPWTQNVYVKGKRQRVDARLVPIGKPPLAPKKPAPRKK